MYNISDKKSAIKEVQKYLFIEQSGFYTDETKEKISDLQKENGLPQSGTVDYETFKVLYSSYKNELLKKSVKADLQVPFPLKFGDQGNHIKTVNAILSELKELIPLESDCEKCAFFSNITETIVNELQGRFKFEINGKIDERFYRRIKNEKQSFHLLDYNRNKK